MATSIRRTDLLSLSNLRNDGRRPNEIRRMRIQMGPLSASASVGGSALVEMGLTTVLAAVRGPLECVRRSDELLDRAMVDVTVKMAPFASSTDRRFINPNTDRRLIEASYVIQQVMEATILLHLYPRSRIEITVLVLADDGSRLCAAINTATLALQDAGIPMKDFACACSAGYASIDGSSNDDTTLVDLNRREESATGGQPAVQLPCAMLPQRGTVVYAQCEARLPNYTALEQVLEAAMEGCRAVFEVMQAAVRDRAVSVLAMNRGQTKMVELFS
ncbi:hypothetical protein ACA910_012815 [Epithemia clementina (nom. ined.)]